MSYRSVITNQPLVSNQDSTPIITFPSFTIFSPVFALTQRVGFSYIPAGAKLRLARSASASGLDGRKDECNFTLLLCQNEVPRKSCFFQFQPLMQWVKKSSKGKKGRMELSNGRTKSILYRIGPTFRVCGVASSVWNQNPMIDI